jgi:hypothetical protein
MAWKKLKHGYICERIIGFSMPINGEIAIISYEGVHIVPLANPDTVVCHEKFAEGGDIYDYKCQLLEFSGRSFPILGLHGGTPKLSSNTGEGVAFGKGDKFVVNDSAGREIFSHDYSDLSGDWRIVTFTPDDMHILFGLPYELEIFQRTA